MASLMVGWMGQQPRGQSRDKADRELGVSSGVKVGDRDRASVSSGLPFLSASLPTSASQTRDRPDLKVHRQGGHRSPTSRITEQKECP